MAYKAELEAYQRQQEETQGYLEQEDPAQIHDHYQYQLQLKEQELEAFEIEKQKLTEMQQGAAVIMLEKQKNEFMKEMEEMKLTIMTLEGQKAQLAEYNLRYVFPC